MPTPMLSTTSVPHRVINRRNTDSEVTFVHRLTEEDGASADVLQVQAVPRSVSSRSASGTRWDHEAASEQWQLPTGQACYPCVGDWPKRAIRNIRAVQGTFGWCVAWCASIQLMKVVHRWGAIAEQ